MARKRCRPHAVNAHRCFDVCELARRLDVHPNTIRTWQLKGLQALPDCGRGALEIVQSWHGELSADVSRGTSDPLFPVTLLSLDMNGAFAPAGLSREGWSGTGPVREIFKRAFALADLPYFNPHSFRDTLVHHAMSLDLSPEEMKAWSQNLGHNDVLTTFISYGHVPTHKRGELIRASGKQSSSGAVDDPIAAMEALLAKMKAAA